QLVGLRENTPLVILGQQHGFSRSRPAVDSYKAFHHIARAKGNRRELLVAILLLERREFRFVLGESTRAALFRLFQIAADVDVPFELLVPDILADVVVFGLTELDGAD